MMACVVRLRLVVFSQVSVVLACRAVRSPAPRADPFARTLHAWRGSEASRSVSLVGAERSACCTDMQRPCVAQGTDRWGRVRCRSRRFATNCVARPGRGWGSPTDMTCGGAYPTTHQSIGWSIARISQALPMVVCTGMTVYHGETTNPWTARAIATCSSSHPRLRVRTAAATTTHGA